MLPRLPVGEHGVDVPVVCNLTRFGLRHGRDLVATYRDYRKIVQSAAEAETHGLYQCAFLIEDPRTCYSLSLWADRGSIANFGTNVPYHGEAARRIFGRLAFDPARGPELCTTKWRLESVTHNLNWADFDLHDLLFAESPARGA